MRPNPASPGLSKLEVQNQDGHGDACEGFVIGNSSQVRGSKVSLLRNLIQAITNSSGRRLRLSLLGASQLGIG